jgi:hypothetical protein
VPLDEFKARIEADIKSFHRWIATLPKRGIDPR